MISDVFVLDHVSVVYGTKTVLSDVSLRVEQGQIMALLGPSGAGKSTLLRLLLGFQAPTQGTLRIQGQCAATSGKIIIPPESRGLSVVFQTLALWPHMTVWENLEFGLISQKLPRPARQERIDAILQRVGLRDLSKRYPSMLSGGEQQRVAIARALVTRPQAVLFDEPLSHLDIVLRQELLAFFRELFAELELTALYVTHDPWEARYLSSHIAILDQGRLAYCGASKALPTQDGDSAFVQGIMRAWQDVG